MKKIKTKHQIIPAQLKCEKHGIYNGFIMKMEGRRTESVCDECARLEVEDERLRFNLRVVQRGKEAIFNRSCVPPRFKEHCFSTFNPTCIEAKRVKEIMVRYVGSFNKAKKNGTSFLFLGSTGTGKTHMACAVAEYLLNSGRSVLYITLADALSQVKVAWKANEDITEDEIIAKFGEFDMLIIDEIGTSRFKDCDQGILFRLANYRYERNLPMIGISKFQEPAGKDKPRRPWLSDLIGDDTVRRFRTGGGGILRFNWNEYDPAKVPF